MKKIMLIIYCALFLVPCAFFSLGMLIPGAAEAAEGGVEMPSLLTDTPVITINSDFGDEFEEYFSKSFAYRNKVVDVFAALKAEVFSEGNEQVIMGQDDFLFFADTLPDYTGSNLMTDEEVNAVADALLYMYEYSTERGADFLFVCAPNKNSIYPEMMPSRYIMNTENRDLDRLAEALNERGVPYIDLRDILSAAKSEHLIYHKRDTHWNNEGARIAFEAMADKLSSDIPNFDLYNPTPVRNHVGDLDTLLFPDREVYDDNVSYDFKGKYIYTTAYSTPMDLRIAARGGGVGKLLMFRDSFANAMIPFAASSFSEVRFERATPYCDNMSLVDSFSPDYVIAMIAERNLRNLIGNNDEIADTTD
ncbi:MAG: hypothetical protein IJ428_05735 [Clostridia bacterium]|nr:hypothetical protein [Clostridia bacterium]